MMTLRELPRETLRELVFQLTARTFAMWEIIGLLALMAYKAPAWVAAPLMLIWVLYRLARDRTAQP